MNGSIKNKAESRYGPLRNAASLCKLPVSFMSACTAIMGYLACDPLPSRRFLAAALGVFLLAAGSAALNNVQDRRCDAGMERTRRRPLPAGRISSAAGIAVSTAALAAGMAVLISSTASLAAPAAGAATVLIYNGVYTPLKKRTMLAFLPGIVCGALPPLIGWLAAGGAPSSSRIIVIVIMFGLWQVPHFWLILMVHGDDYRSAGIPSLLDQIQVPVAKMLMFIWVSAFSLMILMMLPLSLVYTPVAELVLLVIASVIPSVFSIVLLSSPHRAAYQFLFHLLNMAVLTIIITCIIDSVRISSYFLAR